MLIFTKEQLAKIANLDLTKKPRPRRRKISWRVEQVVKAANALEMRGGTINSATIRLIFDELGLMATDEGDQWIGDVLGAAGLGLPTYKKNGKICYEPPPGGITREMVEASFIVPPGYRWDTAEIAEFQKVAESAVPATSATVEGSRASIASAEVAKGVTDNSKIAEGTGGHLDSARKAHDRAREEVLRLEGEVERLQNAIVRADKAVEKHPGAQGYPERARINREELAKTKVALEAARAERERLGREWSKAYLARTQPAPPAPAAAPPAPAPNYVEDLLESLVDPKDR